MDFANRRATQLAVARLFPRDGERVLDVGCGTGAALAQVGKAARAELFGVDPSRTMLAAARARLGEGAVLVDATLGSLPFSGGAFDAALALNVLYFCDHEGAMLADLHRVLKPGGRLVAYVTHREVMQRWSFTRAGLHRLFDAAELRATLHKGGFAIDAIVIHEAAVGPGVRGLFAEATRRD